MHKSVFNAAPTADAARETLYATGFAALGRGKSYDAQRYFGLLLALNPLDERAWVGLGAAHEQKCNWQVAAGFYKLGCTLAPQSAYCRLGEARVRAQLGQTQAAAQLLDEAELLTEDSHMLASIQRLRGEL